MGVKNDDEEKAASLWMYRVGMYMYEQVWKAFARATQLVFLGFYARGSLGNKTHISPATDGSTNALQALRIKDEAWILLYNNTHTIHHSPQIQYHTSVHSFMSPRKSLPSLPFWVSL